MVFEQPPKEPSEVLDLTLPKLPKLPKGYRLSVTAEENALLIKVVDRSKTEKHSEYLILDTLGNRKLEMVLGSVFSSIEAKFAKYAQAEALADTLGLKERKSVGWWVVGAIAFASVGVTSLVLTIVVSPWFFILFLVAVFFALGSFGVLDP